MPKKIDEVEGIGPQYRAKLEQAGIGTVEALLEKGRTPAGRKELSESTGVEQKRVLRWVNMADLFRVKGIGSEYADLLEAAGVDTVKELRNRNPANLTSKMLEVNAQKKLVRNPPSESSVTAWIEEAKGLPPGVEY